MATLPEPERTVVDGIPITSPGRTIVDLAAALGSRELELATARAERAGLIDGAALHALLRRHRGRPGIPVLRAILRDGPGPDFTRSEAERRCLQLLKKAGLPRPHTNVSVGPYELDLFWPGVDLAIEIDGFAHHASRPRFEGDRRKDGWLAARGIQVVRVTWQQITRDALATAVRIGQILALADQRRGPLRDPGVHGTAPGPAFGEEIRQR